jgi:hypothetical protein
MNAKTLLETLNGDHFGRRSNVWDDNIQMDHKEKECVVLV